MNMWKPYLNQRVKLSRKGYAELKLNTPEAYEASKSMRITSFENLGYDHEPIWVVTVDAPEINIFMLSTDLLEPLDGLSGWARVYEGDNLVYSKGNKIDCFPRDTRGDF